ncbi:MAG: bifunctional precorrin-2 dehydrogenase/sirohydrochlorin ferrochelatase [Syntrophomonadaceae bacterium]|nr:bifunctional precorrin-2 dehydrogenase/sirohydrochlorin ferrochelatase [Syntrophomonadaceae bacterium]
MPMMYPVTLELVDKECLVVGGGVVAERKVLSLLECGAIITVVSPAITTMLRKLADTSLIKYKDGCYSKDDLLNKLLVICATNNQVVNQQVAQDCKGIGIWVNVVDQPELCTFHVPAVMRRGMMSISVSTSGASPLLAAKIRKQLEQDFGQEYEILLQIMVEVRKEVNQKNIDPIKRYQIYSKILNSNIMQLIKQGKTEKVKELIAACTSL